MSVHFTITPGIENRIQSWQSYAQIAKEAKTPPRCITISREYGCQGFKVAKELEDLFNAENPDDSSKSPWLVLDRKLLEKLAEDSGFSKTDVEQVAGTSPIFQSLISMFMGTHRAEQFEVFSYTKKAVRHFAQVGNCIIVGRGGASMTQDLSNCFHFRLVAPFEFRVKNIMELKGLSRIDAEADIINNQKNRDDFIQHFTQDSMSDPTLYNLIINNERYTPSQIATIIQQVIQDAA